MLLMQLWRNSRTTAPASTALPEARASSFPEWRRAAGPCALLSQALFLLAACTLCAAMPDQALLSAMRRSGPDIYDIQILKRVPVNSELDLIVALGSPKDQPAGKGDSGWWGVNATLDILLQSRDRPGTIYKIAASKGPGDCDVHVERATAKDVVLSCTPEKGGPGPNRKFVYDIRSKALLKQIDYQPFALRRIFISGESAVLVGSDARQLIAVKYNPAGQPPFELLKGAQAQQWTKQIETSAVTAGSGTNLEQQIYIGPKPFNPVRFGPGNRFTFTRDETKTDPPGNRLVILEQPGDKNERYSLPQSSYGEFARARPARVGNGYSRQGTTIDEAIGPWQIAGGTLWFAKDFYDGEGNSGVGGFGYFDTKALKYRIYSPREMTDWSATAMLVEPEAVWLALANNGEYGSIGGGLLRFNRTTQQVNRIELRELVSEIGRLGDRLVLATDFGAAVLENHTLRRFFVDPKIDGQLEVSESVPENPTSVPMPDPQPRHPDASPPEAAASH